MSRNFRLYLSSDDFPLEAWQLIMGVVSSHPLESNPPSPWHWQWMTNSRVWVTVRSLANPPLLRPPWAPWAEWCVTLDFSAAPVQQRFDATSIIALALVELPKAALGMRVQAMDAFDDASADSIDEWAKIAQRYLDQEAVDGIVEWASSV